MPEVDDERVLAADADSRKVDGRTKGQRIRNSALAAVGLGVAVPVLVLLSRHSMLVMLTLGGMLIGALAPEIWHRASGGVRLTTVNVTAPPGTNWSFAVTHDARVTARRIYNQLARRITTRPLLDGTGTEKAAIKSLKAAFDALTAHLDEQATVPPSAKTDDVEALVLEILNTHLGPFLAVWHPLADKQEESDSWPLAGEFRAELRRLQQELRPYIVALGDVGLVRDPERVYSHQPRFLPPRLTEDGRLVVTLPADLPGPTATSENQSNEEQ
ncbi:hypothetical protein HCC61_23405 [Streptomyces sp. HNM0575]|uniref:hypothetical protein n=1 Tax=Streptomyces sp. HNM0575 TaxID=2716338 RepID=UPI00145E4D44|nr:hypothetical protein [Streptomyces sp. HNM0575]NLU75571.1 hypothetical protein [Streptomyces sp. HNM0575]